MKKWLGNLPHFKQLTAVVLKKRPFLNIGVEFVQEHIYVVVLDSQFSELCTCQKLSIENNELKRFVQTLREQYPSHRLVLVACLALEQVLTRITKAPLSLAKHEVDNFFHSKLSHMQRFSNKDFVCLYQKISNPDNLYQHFYLAACEAKQIEKMEHSLSVTKARIKHLEIDSLAIVRCVLTISERLNMKESYWVACHLFGSRLLIVAGQNKQLVFEKSYAVDGRLDKRFYIDFLLKTLNLVLSSLALDKSYVLLLSAPLVWSAECQHKFKSYQVLTLAKLVLLPSSDWLEDGACVISSDFLVSFGLALKGLDRPERFSDALQFVQVSDFD
ncbi:MAG: hypothetical protein HWE10_09640 [Gammaproteobacteria bacterium]|nr:hypothetical protein [Gammaproteobacteria bacterium]